MTRTVLITGSGSGLGLEFARQCLDRGDTVVLSDLSAAPTPAAEALVARSARAHWVRLDVTSDDDWAAMTDVVAELGGIDLVINNAGIAVGGTVTATTMTSWRRIIEINLLGVVRGSRWAATVMTEQGHGHILNIASLAALGRMPQMGAYNAVKAAVEAFSDTMRTELHGAGIRVSVACPGFVRTPLGASLPADGDPESYELAHLLIDGAHRGPDVVVRRALRAVDANKFLVLTDPEGHAVHVMRRLSPSLSRLGVRWAMRPVIAMKGWPVARGRFDRRGARR